jgi:hypothetical protein
MVWLCNMSVYWGKGAISPLEEICQYCLFSKTSLVLQLLLKFFVSKQAFTYATYMYC